MKVVAFVCPTCKRNGVITHTYGLPKVRKDKGFVFVKCNKCGSEYGAYGGTCDENDNMIYSYEYLLANVAKNPT